MAALALALAAPLRADESIEQPARARLSESVPSASGSLAKRQFSPITLRGGSTLTIVSPERWSVLAEELQAKLSETHQQYTKLFGEIPPFLTTLRLMDEETFYVSTGAPRWTNAMYFRGQIMIPVGEGDSVDIPNLFRSVKHEYTHAVVHALTKGRCPGWLDEGLAQWSEGDENPALMPALLKWLRKHPPVDLALLQGGFTKLDTKMVAAAYAQSLYAANSVIRGYGFERIRAYFEALRSGSEKQRAFVDGFGLSENSFEGEVERNLAAWVKEKRRAH